MYHITRWLLLLLFCALLQHAASDSVACDSGSSFHAGLEGTDLVQSGALAVPSSSIEADGRFRPTVGSIVQVVGKPDGFCGAHSGKIGVIVTDDKSDFPYQVEGMRLKNFENLSLCWFPEGDLADVSEAVEGITPPVLVRAMVGSDGEAEAEIYADADDNQTKLSYLSTVYNEDVSDLELFDTREMFYLYSDPRLPLHLLSSHSQRPRNRWADECRQDHELSSIWEMREWGFIAPDTFLWRDSDHYKPGHTTVSAVGHDTWLEVTRTFIGWKEGNDSGCWFHVRKGSGIFVNTGKTLVLEAQKDDVANGLGSDVWQWCGRAREMGYDSIQVLSMTLDAGSHEFVYCSGRCSDTTVITACVADLELRTGVSADKQCHCDPSISLLNCGNAIAPKDSTVDLRSGHLYPCDLQ